MGKKTIRTVAVIATVLLCFGAIAEWAIEARWQGMLKTSGKNVFLTKSPDQVEREIRETLPVGISLEVVEAVLKYGHFEEHYDTKTRSLSACARNVKGSNWVIVEDLWFDFHFDESLKLTRIEASTHLTGP